MNKYLCKKKSWYWNQSNDIYEKLPCSAVYWSFRLNWWFKHHVDLWKCIFSLPLHLLQDVGPTPSWSLIDHPRCKPVKARQGAVVFVLVCWIFPPVDVLSSNSSLVSPRAPGSNFKEFLGQNVLLWHPKCKQKDLEILWSHVSEAV